MPAAGAYGCSPFPRSAPTTRPAATATPTQDEFIAHLARRARDDPDWWLVVRAYAEGAHMFPDPFKPKRPTFPV